METKEDDSVTSSTSHVPFSGWKVTGEMGSVRFGGSGRPIPILTSMKDTSTATSGELYH